MTPRTPSVRPRPALPGARSARAVVAATLLALAAAAPAGSVELRRGPIAVEVNDQGLVTRVRGIALHALDGPHIELQGPVEEWFSLSYDTPSGRREFAGIGSCPDWGTREPVVPVSLEVDADGATGVTLAGDLEVRSEVRILPGQLVLFRMTLTNLTSHRVDMLMLSREWRTPGTGGWNFPPDMGLAAVPTDVSRRIWMPDGLEPGASHGVVYTFAPRGGPEPTPSADDVPLSLWQAGSFPAGLDFGGTNGISWGDYDQDGWPDVFACASGNLWRNLAGADWVLAANLLPVMPPGGFNYGSAFGDYDSDGRPDIGTEPRGSEGMALLHNLGGTNFVDVATDPAIVDVKPFGASETLCWGDVDGDTDLDAFLPVYPPWVGSEGNFFLWNLGPTGPAGAYRFQEAAVVCGLDNPPPDSARPEGAQLCDVDYDGDLDLYSNGTLYQNVSTRGTPSFRWMTEAGSGIGHHDELDEGAVFFDADLDGDFDLFIVYTFLGVMYWENGGDGSFGFGVPLPIDQPMTGLDLGMSAADWDNDGDIDFTTREVFRRNQFLEEGRLHFTVATHSIPGGHITSATPAWADWDRDGDLDCALGNWVSNGHFYENTLYGPSTPDSARRYIRVKAVRDSQRVARGLETEFGAVVELNLLNLADGFKRRKFVSSANGYLNQNEYALHFGLPADPFPADPAADLRLDVTVDFPNLPEEGTWRVDKFVNPALGDVALATLKDREIKVYRCGRVVKEGIPYEPAPLISPLHLTTTQGLALPSPTTPLPAPVPAPAPGYTIGLAFDTRGATEALRVKEILIDGQLTAAINCPPGGAFNIAFWDVTVPASPVLAATMLETTSSRNPRSYLRSDVVLDPGRDYRLVARVSEYRNSPIAAPVVTGPVRVNGGIGFTDATPCTGADAAAAVVDPANTALAFRFSPSVAAEDPDPVGNRLFLVKDAAFHPVLHSPAFPAAAGNRVLRCDAQASRPCAPARIADVPPVPYTDGSTTPAPGEHFWYRINPYVDCPAVP